MISIFEHQREMERLTRDAKELGLCKDAFLQAIEDGVPNGDLQKRVRHASIIVHNLRMRGDNRDDS